MINKRNIIIIVLLKILLTSYIAVGQSDFQRQQWEYGMLVINPISTRVRFFAYIDGQLVDTINVEGEIVENSMPIDWLNSPQIGGDGWELVHWATDERGIDKLYFKRPVTMAVEALEGAESSTSSILDRARDTVEIPEPSETSLPSEVETESVQLSFSSDEEGWQPVIGPVEFVDGTWVGTFMTSGYGQVEFTQLTGDCDRETNLLFNESRGEAVSGAQAVFTTSGNCSALIDLDNITDSWSLEFKLVEAASPPVVSGEGDGTSLVYGARIDGFIFANSDAEHFFDGSQGDVITITVERTSGTADLMLQLYSPDGSLLFEDDDSGPGLDPLITGLALPVAGQFRIVVTRCGICDAADSAAYRLLLQGD